MRCKLILYFFSLFLLIPFLLLAQDTSVSIPETETPPSQAVEDNDVSEKEQKEKVVIEDVIVNEKSEEEIVEEVIVEEEGEEEIVEDLEKDIIDEALEKEEPKEDIVVEETMKADDSKIEKADTAESPLIAPGEEEIKEVEDMDLILEEEDELLIVDDEEELFLEEEPVESTIVEETPLKDKRDTVAAEIIPPEETGEQPELEKEEIVVQPEIGGKEEEAITVEPEVAIEGTPDKGKSSIPVKIERTRSIDFAKNLKEYRSPKKAMFMSLLLPGLGQAYTKRYWKTALFGSIEAALIGFSVKHAIDGRDKMDGARKFADEHFNPDSFFTFYEDFETIVSPESIDVDVIMFFGDTLSNYKKKYTRENLADYDGEDRHDFDRDIATDEFVHGWDDCEPTFNSFGYNLTDTSNYSYSYKPFNTTDSMWVLYMYELGTNKLIRKGIFGYSENQQKYNRMVSLSNHYYNVSTILLFFLVANHIASAVDAFISARAFNDRLLNKKSAWQHIGIDHQIAFAQDGFHSRLALKVRF